MTPTSTSTSASDLNVNSKGKEERSESWRGNDHAPSGSTSVSIIFRGVQMRQLKLAYVDVEGGRRERDESKVGGG
jgi:hypothetical protein